MSSHSYTLTRGLPWRAVFVSGRLQSHLLWWPYKYVMFLNYAFLWIQWSCTLIRLEHKRNKAYAMRWSNPKRKTKVSRGDLVCICVLDQKLSLGSYMFITAWTLLLARISLCSISIFVSQYGLWIFIAFKNSRCRSFAWLSASKCDFISHVVNHVPV